MHCPISARLIITDLIFAHFCPFLAAQKLAFCTDRRMDRRIDGRTDGWTDGRTNGRTDGKSPHSTGLRPLSGPLPRYSPTLTQKLYKAGQGYR